MFDKILNAVEPYALTLIVLAGASLAGWVEFTNHVVVGYATVFCGILLVVKHFYQTITKKK